MELALVLFILALTAMLAIPRLGHVFLSGRMDGALRTLTRTITYARSAAATGGHQLFLHLDIEKRRYWLSRDASLETEPEQFEDLAEMHSLPAGVRFKTVVTAGRGSVSQGRTTIGFAGNGVVETADIHLTRDTEQEVTVSVDPVTGAVSVHEGDVTQPGLG